MSRWQGYSYIGGVRWHFRTYKRNGRIKHVAYPERGCMPLFSDKPISASEIRRHMSDELDRYRLAVASLKSLRKASDALAEFIDRVKAEKEAARKARKASRGK